VRGGKTGKVWAKEKDGDEQKKKMDNLPSRHGSKEVEVAVAVAVGVVVAGRPREQVPFARMDQSL
jgi:hypothetical protein